MKYREKIFFYIAIFLAVVLLSMGTIFFAANEPSTPTVVIDENHIHDFSIKLPASCKNGKYIIYQCVCGEKYESDEPAVYQHVWGDYQPVDKSELWQCNLISHTCVLCGTVEQIYINPEEYDFSDVDYDSLYETLDNLPEGMEAMYSEESINALLELREDILSRVWSFTAEQAADAAECFKKKLDGLTLNIGDYPRVYINSTVDKISKEYSDARITVVDTEGGVYTPVIDGNAKIKLRGNSTAESSVTKLQYNIKFSKPVDLFGMGTSKKWALMANAFDKTLIRNSVAMELGYLFELDYTSNYHYCDVWLDGKYLGNFMLMENVEVSQDRVDIDINNSDALIEIEYYRVIEGVTYIVTDYTKTRFGINEPEQPTDDQIENITGKLNSVDKAIKNKNRMGIEKLIDIKSFVDVYLLEEFLKNADFYYSSTRFYFKNGILYAGPIWDFDLSAGNCNYEYYYDYNNIYTSGDSTRGFYCRTMPWFRYLFQCDWFKQLVWERYLEMYDILENVYTDNVLGESLINRIVEPNIESFNRNYTEGISTYSSDVRLSRNPNSTYEGNLYFLTNWLSKRNEWLYTALNPSYDGDGN